MTLSKTRPWGMLVLALAGCSGEKSIGSDNPSVAEAGLAAYAASWDGYIEAFEFDSGSDRIRIVLDDEGRGTVLFGDGDPLGPPTDPEAKYPPDGDSDLMVPTSDVLERIAYPVHNARLDDERIRFEIQLSDAFDPWCALQTPVYDEQNDRFNCVENRGLASDGTTCTSQAPNGEWEEVSCAQYAMCFSVCQCDEAECSAVPTGTAILDAILQAEGDELEGSFDSHVIRLERQ